MRIDKPLTREEVLLGDVWPKGEYDFEVVSATDEISKSSGKEMIKLKLRVWHSQGKERLVFDYLVGSLEYKVAHFFQSIGKWETYESGEFEAQDCYGSGRLKLSIKEDEYGTKNTVQDYLLSDEQQAAKSARTVAAAKGSDTFVDDFDDASIPF